VRECENYRTIALISLTSKILLKIIYKRMESMIQTELPVNQAGFRKWRGTRDHIANLKWKGKESMDKRYIYALSTTARLSTVQITH